MQAKTIRLSDLHLNTGQIKDVPKNPRFIKDERYEALKKSIEYDPEMLQLRELVAYDNNGEIVVILGNMRYRAMKELGYKDAPVKVLPPKLMQRNSARISRRTTSHSVKTIGICSAMSGTWKSCRISDGTL